MYMTVPAEIGRSTVEVKRCIIFLPNFSQVVKSIFADQNDRSETI